MVELELNSGHAATGGGFLARDVPRALLVSFAYFLGAVLCIELTSVAGNVAIVWVPNAILLAVLLRSDTRSWPLYFAACAAANLVANQLYGNGLHVAAGFAAVNIVEVLCAAVLVRQRIGPRIALDSLSEVTLFVTLAVLVAPAIGALLGTALIMSAYGDSFSSVFWSWWVADAMGIVLVTPLVLTLRKSALQVVTDLRIARDAALLALAAAGVGLAIFSQSSFPLLFLAAPVLLWAAFRFGTAGGAATGIVLGAIAVWSTLDHRGPLSLVQGTMTEQVMILNLFVGVSVLSVLALAALVAERDRAEAAVRRAHAELEKRVAERTSELAELAARNTMLASAVETATNGIFITDPRRPDSPIIFANAGFTKITGYTSREVIGRNVRFLQGPDANAAVRQEIRIGIEDKHPAAAESLNYRKDGTEFWQEIRISPIFDPAGNVRYLVGIQTDITQRKRAELALGESEERLRQIAENIREVVWLADAKKNEVLYVNPAYERVWGRSRESLYRQRMSFRDAIHPDDCARIVAAAPDKHDGMFAEEYRIFRPNGEMRWLSGWTAPIRDQTGQICRLVGITEDITERKNQEAALRESRDLRHLVIDNLPFMIVYIDTEEKFRFINNSCAKWYGRTPDDIVGRSVAEIHGSEYEKFCPRIEAVLSGEAQTFETTARYPDGAVRDIRAAYIPHRGEGSEVLGFISLVEDISERNRAERQHRQTEKMEALGVLAGGIAHDFNNILFAIIGLTEATMRNLAKDDVLRVRLGGVLEAGERAKMLVQQILTFSRQDDPRPRRVNLRHIVGEAMRLVRASKPPTIEIRGDLDIDCGLVVADPTQIHQVVINLATNAMDAMEGTQGRIELYLDEVIVGRRRKLRSAELHSGSYVRLSVRDNGRGMDGRTADRIFDPFFTTKCAGTGLGLAVDARSYARKLVTVISGGVFG